METIGSHLVCLIRETNLSGFTKIRSRQIFHGNEDRGCKPLLPLNPYSSCHAMPTMPMNLLISNLKPLLAALLAVLLWAFAFPASKAVLPYFSVEQVVGLRYLVACSFYGLLFAAGYFPLPKWDDVPLIVVLGVLGVTVYQLLFVYGVGQVAAGTAALLIATIPVFSCVLARVFLHEKLSKTAYGGISLSLLGVAMITLGRVADGSTNELFGYLMLLIAVLSISVYFVFQKPFFVQYSPLSMTSYTCLAGTIPLLYFLPQSVEVALRAPGIALLHIAAMGVFSSGVGFLLWFYALSKLPAGTVTSFLFLQPVFVTIMAWLWLHEIPPLQAFIGGAVTLLGVGLILVPKKPHSHATARAAE